jgi:phosphoribosylamine---glycine ligase
VRGQRVLIVGSGAREHALAWKLGQSPDITALYVAPGNAGTGVTAENVPVSATDIAGLLRFVEERDITLTVVGPEAPLALGLADTLRARGRRVFGPDAAAAQIESSKAFAKDLMKDAGVPTAGYAVFDRYEDALAYLSGATYPVVLKADGLAAGKGVSICPSFTQARDVLRSMMVDDVFGSSGNRVVIEEVLSGPEVSLIALVDGERVAALPLAQDHKRLGDGDTGPNTGGMGAYVPVPFLSAQERDALVKLAIEPVIRALAAAGTPYRGALYAGLMLTETGPKVLEFNCRFGDPETQVLLPLLADDLLPWLEAAADGHLPDHQIPIHNRSAVGVVLAAPGYPDKPVLGGRIDPSPPAPLPQGERGDRYLPELLVFHAGTGLNDEGHVITAGGRVLTVVGLGDTIDEAAEQAYATPIHFEGMQRRTDIAWQARRSDFDERPFLPSPLEGEGPRVRGSVRGRIAVLVSGDGSNLQALIDARTNGTLAAEIAVVVSHRPGVRALDRADAAGIPAVVLPVRDWRDPIARRQYELELLDLLRPFQLDLIVLAGWMFIFSGDFLADCPTPILNIHPALLPMNGDGEPDESLDARFPILRGAHTVRDALALRLPYTGVSVHYVTPEVDAGPVVLREIVPIDPADDEDALYRRIKSMEHQLLPQAVGKMLETVHAGGAYA